MAFEDHRAIIRYVSYDLKQRVFLDYNSLSESRFHDGIGRFLCHGEWISSYQYLEVHLGHGFHLSVRCSRCPQSGDLCRELALLMDSAVRAPGPCG